MPLKVLPGHFVLLLVIGAFASACGDCVQEVSGHVLDSETGRPVQEALVYKINKSWDQTTTDSLGAFTLSSISGGLSGCPPMKVRVEKQGYLPAETSIDAGGEKNIRLTKIPQ
jgi:hypothetical protein